jgi:sugar lactone lactonase YvrE
LDEYRGHIYGVRGNRGIKILYDGDPHLMIAGLSDISPGGDPTMNEAAFTAVPLDGMVMPNGLCIDTAGHLFIADTLGGKIYRFTIDADDPMNLDGPYDTGLTGLGSPNGILALNGVLYFTDGGAVKKTAIAADGRLGPVEKLYSGRVVLDDLTAYDDTLVVCDYMKGTVFQLSLQGKVLRETKTETFCFPSSVTIAKGPLFDVDGLVVTEKGILYEPSSSFGNRAVLFSPDGL